ncbi:MAG TPA: hypothetical protein VFQ35_07690, partial [Polyangiaceae bacterium]|nr:hypothetical protein [Polyangiaceae bacterium]
MTFRRISRFFSGLGAVDDRRFAMQAKLSNYGLFRGIGALSVALGALVCASRADAVGTRHFLLDKGADFKGGDLKGVAVDSAGGVHAGLTLTAAPIQNAATIWAALPQRDGSVLLGTGNEGKLMRLAQGASSVVGETKGLAVTSLVE